MVSFLLFLVYINDLQLGAYGLPNRIKALLVQAASGLLSLIREELLCNIVPRKAAVVASHANLANSIHELAEATLHEGAIGETIAVLLAAET